MGLVHSFETFTTVDGPGIRFILFLSNCPLRCKYCHNPDTWACKGKEYSVDDIVNEILKYKNYYKNGGVTISGGEPLLQIDFVIEIFKKLKKYNMHTAIDTSGSTFNENQIEKFDELNKYTDLYLLDIKEIDEKKHIELTGKSNKNILEFAQYLSKNNKKVWIRHVIVPTINLDKEDLIKTKEFIDTLNNVERVDVLPYHTLGVHKYKELGLKYPLEGVRTPTSEEIKFAKEILGDK